MKNLTTLCLFICASFLPFCISAQTPKTGAQNFTKAISYSEDDWVSMMQDPHANFYDIQKAFNKKLAAWQQTHPVDKDKVNKGGEEEESDNMPGYYQYKRWEAYMAPRVYPTGSMLLPVQASLDFNNYFDQNNHHTAHHVISATPHTWSLVGPTNFIPSNSSTGNGGNGRVNCVRYNPVNTKTIYCGAADGGLWKSFDQGVTWSTNTDQLTAIGVTDLAINPSDTNIMYLAIGDADGAFVIHPDCPSIGVLKSTDNGTTWNTTGLNTSVSSGLYVYKLIIDPSNPNNLYAATNQGIYMTTNAGTNWTEPVTGYFTDIAFMPGTSSTIYAVPINAGGIWRSVNSGGNWSNITSGLPSSGVFRSVIAVTAANPNYLYLMACNNSTYGLQGIYLSTNGGTSFTTQATSPNVLSNTSNGSGTDGQGYYDLTIAANPKKASEVVVGGVNIWMSTNSGANWTLKGQWNGGGGLYEHADVHSLTYLPDTSRLYAGNDGGCFYTSGNAWNSWTNLSSELVISQNYDIGLSANNANLLIQGLQDNGTNLGNGSTWGQTYGGDGLYCFIDYSNDNNMYATYVEGTLLGSTNGGASWNNLYTSISEYPGAWETPWVQDPTVPNTIYAGFNNVWKSTNKGSSWTKLTLGSNGTQLVCLAVAPSNNQIIYAANATQLFRTINGGTSWSNITGTLPVSSDNINFIAVNPTKPDSVWVTFSGYDANRVYFTANGGTSWTNVSTGLPNIPTDCITYQKGSADLLYVGTDLGVYYKKGTENWGSFSNGLPNVQVTMLQVNDLTGYVEAGTYGRDIWQVPAVAAVYQLPTVAFSASAVSVCVGSNVQFTDASTSDTTITAYSWTFTGGNPATSTIANPIVTYTTSGTYNVTESVTNAFGQKSLVKSSYITASAQPVITIASHTDNNCLGGTGSATANAASGGASPYTYSWSPSGGTNLTASNLTANTYVITVTDANSCTGTASVTITQPASALAANASVTSNINCYGNSTGSAQSAPSGGTSPYTYTWSSGEHTSSISGKTANTYTLTVQDANNCSATATVTITQPQFPVSINIYVDANVNCNGNSTGQINCYGGYTTPPYTYLWTPTSSTNNILTGLTAGTYMVKVSDALGCSSTASETITQPGALHDSVASITSSACIAKGSATIGVKYGTAPYTYSWSPNVSTTATCTTLSAGTYVVTVKDAHGCFKAVTFSINAGATVRDSIASASTVYPTCYAGMNGHATVGAKYGALPYTYHWTGSQTTPTAVGLGAGTYTVQVTDHNGCTSSVASVVITQPLQVLLTGFVEANIRCNGGSTGQINAYGSNGITPYTYNWSNATTGQLCTGLSIGTYTVNVTDAHGCSSTNTLSETLTQPALLRDSVASSGCVSSQGTVTIGVRGGTSPYTYAWSPGGGTSATMTGLSNGGYTIAVKDNHGCVVPNLNQTVNCSSPEPKKGDAPDNSAGNNITLYPNPTTGEFTIDGLTQGQVIQLYDYAGNLIRSMRVDKLTMLLNLTGQPNGIYLIRILNSDGTRAAQKKVVKTQ